MQAHTQAHTQAHIQAHAGGEIHPDLRSVARWLPRGVGHPWFVRLSRWLPTPKSKPPAGITLTVHPLQGTAQESAQGPSVRVLQPASTQSSKQNTKQNTKQNYKQPAILWIHGGGYVIGSAQTDDSLCARFVRELGAVVVSVDYRLAPENPYPIPLEDCFAAYMWLHEQAESLGIDPQRVIIAGQSAGGGLAAALAQLIHDRHAPTPRLQLLVYPMLDDRTVLRQLNKEQSKGFRLWNEASNRLGWSLYLGKEAGSAQVPIHAVPARRENVAGLPPAWIGVGTNDLFYAEDMEYAQRLKQAGIPVDVEVVSGAFHGFDIVAPQTSVSQAFWQSQIRAIKAALDMI